MPPPPVLITNYCWWVDSFSATARSTAAMTRTTTRVVRLVRNLSRVADHGLAPWIDLLHPLNLILCVDNEVFYPLGRFCSRSWPFREVSFAAVHIRIQRFQVARACAGRDTAPLSPHPLLPSIGSWMKAWCLSCTWRRRRCSSSSWCIDTRPPKNLDKRLGICRLSVYKSPHEQSSNHARYCATRAKKTAMANYEPTHAEKRLRGG